MNRKLLPLLLALPLTAQGFADGPAFGGSSLFQEGLSPLGNPARFDKGGQGFVFGFEDGDLKAKGFKDAGRDLAQGLALSDAALQLKGLQGLADRPYAERRRAYGVAWLQQGGLVAALSREERTALFVAADADPAHVGSTVTVTKAPRAMDLSLNTTRALLRRTETDRFILGAGGAGSADEAAYGMRVRIERIRWGQADPLPGPAFGPADERLGNPIPTTRDATVANLDMGMDMPMGRSFRFALTGEHLVPHRYWGGVEAKAQFKAGLSWSLTPTLALRAEADLNKAQRLPLPVDQKSAAASVRLDLGGPVLLFGAERRQMEGRTWNTLGASLHFGMGGTRVGVGFQFGEDKPLKAGIARIDG